MFKNLCNSTLTTKGSVFSKGGLYGKTQFLVSKCIQNQNQRFLCYKLYNNFQSSPLQALNYMKRSTFTTIKEQCWEEKKYKLPDFMQVKGTASGSLPPEQVIIEFDVETLNDSAGTSLQQNNQIISNAIGIMKSYGIEKDELTTQNLKIYPTYQRIFNESTRVNDETLLGYKVENKLKLISKKIDLTGKVIDAAVSSGISKVSYVAFEPTSQKIKELKDSLIAVAIKDSTTRAKLALNPLGYEIKAVKNIELDPVIKDNSRARSILLGSVGDDLGETQLFQNSENYTISLNVSFIIGKVN